MCTEVKIERRGLRSLYASNVRELARHLRVIVPGSHLNKSTRINRMAQHCLCPVDVEASAKASGYEVVQGYGEGFLPGVVIRKA